VPLQDERCRISKIELCESSVIRRSAEIELERRVAISDLIEDNRFRPIADMGDDCQGPFQLSLSIQDVRLVFDISSDSGAPLATLTLPLQPFRKIIKEYFIICESYFSAVKNHISPSRIEAIDMGRRGIHNEGSEKLKEMLSDRVIMDMDTARRLFTLVCVLNFRPQMP